VTSLPPPAPNVGQAPVAGISTNQPGLVVHHAHRHARVRTTAVTTTTPAVAGPTTAPAAAAPAPSTTSTPPSQGGGVVATQQNSSLPAQSAPTQTVGSG